MKLSPKKLAVALYEATRDKSQAETDKIIVGLVKFLAKKNAFRLSDKIIEEYGKYHDKMAGIARIDVKSARALTAEMKKTIEAWAEKNLDAKKVILNESVDPELLGGVVLRHDDLLLDASVKNMLLKLRKVN